MKDKKGLTFWKGFVIGIAGTVIVGALLAFFLFPLVLKHRNASALEYTVGLNRVRAAIPRKDKRMTNPLTSDFQTVSAGKAVFLGNCSVCHGTNGTGDTSIGRNLFPPAADLTSPGITKMTDGEIAWITGNGLSFVGMPAFGSLLDDKQIWQAVTYIRNLPSQSDEQGPPTGQLQSGTPGPAVQAQGQTISEIAQGKELYILNGCVGCHGTSAQGGAGPRLSGTLRSFDAVLARVRRGGGPMPSYGQSQISDSEVGLIYKWLESKP